MFDLHKQPSHNLARLIIVLTGIVLGQFILYGPSLVGRKILLPLDLLAQPGVYLPSTPELAGSVPQNTAYLDLAYSFEPARRFAASEFRAGRLPTWAPYQFAGAPFLWSKLSPFLLLECSTESPVVLAWAQLMVAVVAGIGAYAFCRRGLGVSFWPAAVAAWCYPLTGFFVLWQGFHAALPVCWLPWMLLAVEGTIRGTWGAEWNTKPASGGDELIKLNGLNGSGGPSARNGGNLRGHTVRWPSRVAPPVLALVTCLVLVSGQLDVAGQVLLVSGLFALWRIAEAFCRKETAPAARRPLVIAVLRKLATAYALGLILAASAILPVLEYSRTGARMELRSGGREERSPVGLAALPQVVLPRMYGSGEAGSLPIFPKGQETLLESSAAGYTGVLATLVAAPLAFCSRRHRAINGFWLFLSVFGLSWCLNIPGFVQVLRLPGLNMMSHNRLALSSSFAFLALAVTGLEVLRQAAFRRSRWLLLPAALLLGLCGWCLFRSLFPPEPLATQLTQSLMAGHPSPWADSLEKVWRAQAWFAREYLIGAAWCGLGVLVWALLWFRSAWAARLFPLLAVLLLADLLRFGAGRNPQCDPALYYPRIPVLEEVARSVPGRVIGYDCLPATLARLSGLRDIRGCDGVDPARLVQLLMPASEPNSTVPPYAVTQWLIPKAAITPEGDVRLPAVLDMLGVRYVIYRGTPPPEARPAFQGPDYWVLVNSNAMPRVYVPERVELVTDSAKRLQKLSAPEFDPREVAIVESPVNLPLNCRGKAVLADEIPTRVTVDVRMETPGLVVLADLWDKGWQAYLNGTSVPVLRVNHAVRGVVVPTGQSKLEFRYRPASLVWGLRLSAMAGLALLGWVAAGVVRSRKTPATHGEKMKHGLHGLRG